jgi:hypothetical protein
MKSLAYYSAKALKVPANKQYINTNKSRVNVPLNYLKTAQNKLHRKIKRRGYTTGNNTGHFNLIGPGVYKNKHWLYFYHSGEPDEAVWFFNSKISPPFLINRKTGKRRPVSYYRGSNNVKGLELTKRSAKYNTWNSYVKRATKFLKKA